MKNTKIKFTGERMIPELNEGYAFYYEHISRYLFTSQFTNGKRVLDMGCGVGYGVDIIATNGNPLSILGFDIDNETIEYAKAYYQKSTKIKFIKDDVLNFSNIPKQTFDIVTCFEVIEHISEQEKVLNNIVNSLNESGILFISTPNKYTYPDGNQFHKLELYPEEFTIFLNSKFKYVTVLHQTFEFVEKISNNQSREHKSVLASIDEVDPKHSQYLLAICSNSPIPKFEEFLYTTSSVDRFKMKEGILELSEIFVSLEKRILIAEAEIIKFEKEKISLNNELLQLKKESSSKIDELLEENQKLISELGNKVQLIENIESSISYKFITKIHKTKIYQFYLKIYKKLLKK